MRAVSGVGTMCRGAGRARAAGLFVLALVASIGPAAAEVTYRVEFAGLDAGRLKDTFDGVSELVGLADRPPASRTLLRRRAEGDMELLMQVLHAEGYYAGRLEYEIVPQEYTPPALPSRYEEEVEPPTLPRMLVRVIVAPGEVYRVGRITLRLTDPGQLDPVDGLAFDEIGLAAGEPARSRAFVAAERKLVDWLGRRGYPFTQVLQRKFVVDHADRTVAADYLLDAGAPARFGPVEIQGAEDVDRKLVRRRLAWTEGEPFDIHKLQETRDALVATGLFASVAVHHAEAATADGALPMRLELESDDHRSIGIGAQYSTSEGAGGRLYWEHRNLFGGGERFRAEAVGAQIRQKAQLRLRLPDFLDDAQSLAFTATAERERPAAFDADRVGAVAALEREFGEFFAYSVGGSLEWSLIDDDIDRVEVLLAGVPLVLRRDSADDLLDPTEGGRLRLTATPYFDLLGTDRKFVVLRASETLYLPLTASRRFVLSARATAGTILGEPHRDVPIDKRFFAGGGGTIRGYGFQRVGPLDADGDPVGGRSILAGTVELRARVSKRIGVVAFVEAGNVYRDAIPNLRRDQFFGAGGGLRYFTPIGPIRVDIGVPLNRRDKDDAFQFYISLGQAF